MDNQIIRATAASILLICNFSLSMESGQCEIPEEIYTAISAMRKKALAGDISFKKHYKIINYFQKTNSDKLARSVMYSGTDRTIALQLLRDAEEVGRIGTEKSFPEETRRDASTAYGDLFKALHTAICESRWEAYINIKDFKMSHSASSYYKILPKTPNFITDDLAHFFTR